VQRQLTSLRLTSFTVALCASLTLHVLLLVFAQELYVRSLATLRLMPADTERDAHSIVGDGSPVVMVTPAQLLPPHITLGRSDGAGTASDDSPGDEPMQARQAAHDQPLLSRDPVGPGRLHDEPAASFAPPGEGGAGGAGGGEDARAAPPPEAPAPLLGASALAQLNDVQSQDGSSDQLPRRIVPAPPEQSPLRGPEQRRDAKTTQREEVTTRTDGKDAMPEAHEGADDSGASDPPHLAKAPSEPAAAPPAPAPAPAPAEVAAAQAPGAPGAPTRAADPAPQGPSESDPFTSEPGIEFHGGRIEARVGRRHRITHPRINLAGIVDMVSLTGRIVLVLELRIDATGNVAGARIVRSSGSEQIDQAWRLAAYEWWFEPLKDKSGQPRASETFPFSIRFY
jgi:TonB family protein